MLEDGKISFEEPNVNYGANAEIQRTGFLTASRLPAADSDTHEAILLMFRSAAGRVPNYDDWHACEDPLDFPSRPEDWETDRDGDSFRFPARPGG